LETDAFAAIVVDEWAVEQFASESGEVPIDLVDVQQAFIVEVEL
jgi:hypothetical protein